MHDEEVYPEPHNFNPDRYTKCPEDTTLKVQPDPRQWVFGFGRRVCPGVNIAESSIFIQIVTVLATLNIRCAVDAKGAEIKPKQVFSTGIARYYTIYISLVTRIKRYFVATKEGLGDS